MAKLIERIVLHNPIGAFAALPGDRTIDVIKAPGIVLSEDDHGVLWERKGDSGRIPWNSIAGVLYAKEKAEAPPKAKK